MSASARVSWVFREQRRATQGAAVCAEQSAVPSALCALSDAAQALLHRQHSTARLSGAISDTFQPHRFGLCYTLFVIVVEQLSHRVKGDSQVKKQKNK